MNNFLKRLIVYCNISIITLFFIATPACATMKKGFHAKVIDPELVPYTDVYFKMLKQECPKYNVKKIPLYVIEIVDQDQMDEPDWIGVCIHMFAGFHIKLKKQWWNAASDKEKLQLVFHEMAHCLIEREHDPSGSHYMYAYFRALPQETYTRQAIIDIRNYCETY